MNRLRSILSFSFLVAGSALLPVISHAQDVPELVQALADDVAELSRLSPTMESELNGLYLDGWEIRYTTAAEGHLSTVGVMGILIDNAVRGNPEQATQLLSHEMGHALYNVHSASWSGLTRQEWIDAATDEMLRNEARAVLMNCEIRAQILINMGPDIGVNTSDPANAPFYSETWWQLRNGQITQDQAETAIAARFANEIASITGQPYGVTCAGIAADQWDAQFGSTPPDWRAP